MNRDRLTNELTDRERANLGRRAGIRKLHEEGFTPREIAFQLNLSVQAIYKQLSNMGITPNPRRAS